MRRTLLLALALALGAPLIGELGLMGCVGTRISAQSGVVRTDIEKAKKSGAYTCAPRELAMAETHVDFAENELAQGDVLRAQHHIDLAVENANKALANSKDCAPKRVMIKTKTDKDGDGITDDVDACPDEPEDFDGFEDEDGCPDPDNDGDGVLDVDDRCPNTPGPASNQGCPYGDRDGDGIPDNQDKCPELPGVAQPQNPERHGCPTADKDGDGIPDDLDKCPDVAGQPQPDNPARHGCPICPEDPAIADPRNPDRAGCFVKDSDGDGVMDHKDKCPLVAGPAANNGCPYCPVDTSKAHPENPTREGCPTADTDGDGFLDHVDACPKEAGVKWEDDPSKDGCPKKFKLIVIKKDKIEIRQQVQFDTGKATIRPASANLLAEVGDAIRSSNLTKVVIEGHTDDVGDDNFNMKLSQDRANSVRTWLITKERVDPGILEAIGYGEERPIASNRTNAGRQQNRRVEFKVER
jgi:OOP family OmpA-OmpF porin